MKATIRALNLYPIKGCRGIGVEHATLAATGLEVDGIGDREWVVVDDEGEFLSQRELPAMALIAPRFGHGALFVRAPGMLELQVPFGSEGDVVSVRVWNDTVSAVTQGEVGDAWFSTYLGRPARLVRFDPEHTRLASHRFTGKHDAPYKFADAFALLVTNQASLDDLNARLSMRGHAPAAMARFRPNIVVDGLPAYEEDYVKELRLGELAIRPVKPCARCTVPGVDPDTGATSSYVPDLLATYRGTEHGVMFGVNAIVTAGAGRELRIGDEFDVELKL
jgi:uncharacterized protein YcbX